MAILIHFLTFGRARVGWSAVLLAALMFFVPASANAATEYEMKAVFLYNFIHFVDWPERAFPPDNQPLIIGVVGKDPFGAALDAAIRNETIDGRPLVVRRFDRGNVGVGGCHLVFICRSEAAHLPEIMAQLKNRAVLTVSDLDHFVHNGGMIGLVLDQGKVRLQINVENAKAAHLVISSKLLRPAQLVIRDPEAMLAPIFGDPRYSWLRGLLPSLSARRIGLFPTTKLLR